jgi:hypothetical protein
LQTGRHQKRDNNSEIKKEIAMKCNVGGIDRILRVVVGLAIIGYGAMVGSWLGAIGLVPLLTGLFSFCPFYPIFGINTGCKKG